MYLKFLFPKDHHVERKMLSQVQGTRLLPLEEDWGEPERWRPALQISAQRVYSKVKKREED